MGCGLDDFGRRSSTLCLDVKRIVIFQALKPPEHRGRRYTSVRGAGAPTERRQAVMKKNSLMGDALMSASLKPVEGAHG